MSCTYNFEWNPAKEQLNIRKHQLDFHLASSVFKDPSQLTLYDEEHSSDEDRWITIGLDRTGIIRLVVHTFEQIDQESFLVRIISARKASVNEQNVYHRRKR